MHPEKYDRQEALGQDVGPGARIPDWDFVPAEPAKEEDKELIPL